MSTVALIILDGLGNTSNTRYNAFHLANTPCLDKLLTKHPTIELSASGQDVGLPAGQMGNSEVGHMTIGSGRAILQDLDRINKSIENKDFATNQVLLTALNKLKANGNKLHIMGLCSDGGVHSHIKHMLELIKVASGLEVCLHLFTDGRDTEPKSAERYTEQVMALCNDSVQIATISGRYFAMDRDNNWDRVSKAFTAIVNGSSAVTSDCPKAAITNSYAQDLSDEFIEPVVISDYKGICPGDLVINVNFRADRVKQLSYALTDKNFSGFERNIDFPIELVTMTRYAEDLDVSVLFPPEKIVNTLGEYAAKCGLTQLRIAETEKYAHVTFFFNGGEDCSFSGEERKLIPSPKVATYDLKPEMSAFELTEALVGYIKANKFDLIICNYANPDMVGHTGDLDAAVKAVECVDQCLAKVLAAISEVSGEAVITADHGNCEEMFNSKTGQPHTAHTTNLVPMVYFGNKKLNFKKVDKASLADLAPSILQLLGKNKPVEMTGNELFEI
jgi:2,3-bisphosphoglycerate-independent phosphoglycerate mutase